MREERSTPSNSISAPSVKIKILSEMSQREVSRYLLLYMGSQLVLGAMFSMLNFEQIEWLRKFLLPVEAALPTFKTAFVQSSTPVASKLLLAVWWVTFIPWGMWWSCRVTSGFKPDPAAVKRLGFPTIAALLVAATFCGWMLVSLLSFHDYSYYFLNDKFSSPSRGDLVATLMSSGCFAMSLWLAASSLFICVAASGLVLFPRAAFEKILASKGAKP